MEHFHGLCAPAWRRAVDALQRAEAPLNSVGGFVRQIIGWREFMRGDGQPATSESREEAKKRAGYQGQLELTIVRRGNSAKVTVDVGIDPH